MIISLPDNPDPAVWEILHEARFGTKKLRRKYHPAKVNSARRSASPELAWLLSDLFQIEWDPEYASGTDLNAAGNSIILPVSVP